MHSIHETRKKVKEKYGRASVVTLGGLIHVLGKMPNTEQYGYYLLGVVGAPEIEALLWGEDEKHG